MKTGILALFVLVAVSQSEALKCYCGGLRVCPGNMETCSGTDSVCASVIFKPGPSFAPPSHFKGCMTSSSCTMLNLLGVATAFCCQTDLCNR